MLFRSADILIVSVGALASIAVEAAAQAYREGVGVTVIDPRWVKPLPQAIVTMAQRYKQVVVMEDGIRHGGIGSTLAEQMRDAGVEIPVHTIGIPLTFIEHSKRAEILNDLGITAQQVARNLVELHATGELPIMEGMQRPSDENADQSQTR